jgi:hypothetical protein
MKMRIGTDVGIPLGVGVADVLLAWMDERRVATNPAAFQFEPIFGPVAALAGVGMMMGDFWAPQGQVIAHAGMPLAVRSIYTWARQQGWLGGGASRRVYRTASTPTPAAPVGRVGYGYPAPAEKPQFAYQPAY